MNNLPRIPDPEKRAGSVARMREICAAFDEQIVVLEKLSNRIEAENQKNPFYIYCQNRKQQYTESQQQGQLSDILPAASGRGIPTSRLGIPGSSPLI
ncbi:hypothetical protein [Pseudanabaena sp. PCC 6802]|uniref:hypothetical protein n=1 Tax=Pseudanabaena sp. PCC 6802 TaxID=118173 RepID=UPI0003488635|nr:hypothetical protein [Pseudanabaena sp. PCC 6802]